MSAAENEMDVSALLLSRVQFGFTVSFHIIFPSFTIGLAAWLAFLEAMSLATGRAVYRRLFDFWVRIFAVALGEPAQAGAEQHVRAVFHQRHETQLREGALAPARPRSAKSGAVRRETNAGRQEHRPSLPSLTIPASSIRRLPVYLNSIGIRGGVPPTCAAAPA
jgi:hypothetical protein